MNQNQVEAIVEAKDAHHGVTVEAETVEAEIVEINDVHHGVTVEVENAKIGIRARRGKAIGPASSAVTVTSPSGLNVIDVDETKTVQGVMIQPIRHLEEATQKVFADWVTDEAVNASLEIEVGGITEVGVPMVHSEIGAVVDSTHKVMNRILSIGVTEAYRWGMKVAALTMSGWMLWKREI